MSIDTHQSVQVVDKRNELRKLMRKRRRALTYSQQKIASRKLYKRTAPSKLFRFSRRIAFSMARAGEISPHLLLLEAQRRKKKCYLPVMGKLNGPRLYFREFKKGHKLVRNSFGILEPARQFTCKPFALSLVLMPLVAFDINGNRLGMGKGYYDRAFSFLRRSVRQRPILLGLAHECQRAEELEVASWDVPLNGVVTDEAWYRGQPIRLEVDQAL
ncbi:MAG: 5-formyltetrahydrofolate cyclo-ligase [Pseudomonadota bacterium]